MKIEKNKQKKTGKHNIRNNNQAMIEIRQIIKKTQANKREKNKTLRKLKNYNKNINQIIINKNKNSNRMKLKM